MTPESGYPIETSSNDDDKSGLSDENEDPWTPADDDKTPTVTITVTDDGEDKYIESVTIPDTTNVGTVVIVVIQEDGTRVSQY